jgi:hypothetical protein
MWSLRLKVGSNQSLVRTQKSRAAQFNRWAKKSEEREK